MDDNRILVVGAGAPGNLFRPLEPVYDDEPQQDSDWDDGRARNHIRIGNNRYHVPKHKARAKAKARKQAQKAQRRR